MTKRLPLGTRAACAEDYVRKRYGQSGLVIASIRHDVAVYPTDGDVC